MPADKGHGAISLGRALIGSCLLLCIWQCARATYGQAVEQQGGNQGDQAIKPDPGCANIGDSVKVHRGLIDPRTVSDAFGRRIAHRYVVIQVTIANRSKDYEFLIHDLSLDVVGMLSDDELKSLTKRRNRFLEAQLQEKQKQLSSLTEGQQRETEKLKGDIKAIEEQMAQPPTNELSSEELSIVRGVAEIGQALDPRNLVLRALRGAGTIAGGITGVTTFGESYAPSVAAFNGPALTAYADVFPDFTINELNRLNDSAYAANTLVPKEQSKVLAIFMPQALFMDSKQRRKFWKDPISLKEDVDFRLIEVIVRGCFIAEVQQKQPSVLAAVIESDEMKKFQEDQPQVKGRILGQSLSGATLGLKNEDPKGLSITPGEASADEQLNFIIKSDKPVAPGTVLRIEVSNKGVSQVTALAVGYQAEVPTLGSVGPSSGAQGARVRVTLTGTHLLPGPAQVLVSGDGVKVTSVDVKSSTSIEALLEIDGGAQPGERDVQVLASAGPSKPVKFNVTKAAVPPK
jgi:hypothetical protein